MVAYFGQSGANRSQLLKSNGEIITELYNQIWRKGQEAI